MSFTAINWAFDQTLACAHKFVLVALADNSNIYNECYPSQRHLAEKCGLSRSRVNTILGELEAQGFITTISRTRKNGGDTSNGYQLSAPLDRCLDPNREDRLPAPVPGVVYVICDGARVKIGIARNVQRRLKGLQTANPLELRLEHAVTCDMRTARNIEMAAHANFEATRQMGEWFDITPADAIAFIIAEAERRGVSHDETGGVAPAVQGGVAPEDGGVSHGKTPNKEPSLFNHQKEPPPETGAGALVPVVANALSELELAVEAFNRGAEICPKWTRCTKLTDARAKAIGARLREVGLAGWLKAVQQAVDSAHLGGPVPTTGTHQGWRMDIGWFAKAENFTKCFEGSYAPGRQARPLGLDSIAMGINAFLDQQQGDGGDAHA